MQIFITNNSFFYSPQSNEKKRRDIQENATTENKLETNDPKITMIRTHNNLKSFGRFNNHKYFHLFESTEYLNLYFSKP